MGRDAYPGQPRLPSTLHGFSYVSNNPINRVDPSGLCEEVGDENCWAVYEAILRIYPEAPYDHVLNGPILLHERDEESLSRILDTLRSGRYPLPSIELTLEAGFVGLDAIIRFFEADKSGNAATRLEELLYATANYKIMGLDKLGLQFGIEIPGGPSLCEEFEDKQYYTDPEPEGSSGYYAWHLANPNQDNQMGHFLTAVALAYHNNDGQLYNLSTFVADASRGWMDLPGNKKSNMDIAIRVIIGHEMIGDAGLLAGSREQYLVTVDYYVSEFISAISYDIQGNKVQRDIHLGNILYAFGGPETLEERPGNSIQDLRLSLKGWRFGYEISEGFIATSSNAAAWLRSNLAR